MDVLYVIMSLNIQPLPISFDFSNATTSPTFVEGRGQKVYWQNCWIKVYDKGQTESRQLIDKCDGWAVVLGDTNVLFGGQGGSVKEM
ncbi:hypothetical protein V8C37DRAFT_397283 [Trichoderma ceciliae]